MSDIPFGFGVPSEDPEDGRPGGEGAGREGRPGSGNTGGGAGGGKGSSGGGKGPGGGKGSRGGDDRGGDSGGGAEGGRPTDPFGFGSNPLGALFGMGGLPGGSGASGQNPLGGMLGAVNPADLGAAFQRLGQMLSFDGGPVNWDLARDIARQAVAAGAGEAGKDRSVAAPERSAVTEAVRLADLWLDSCTAFPSGSASAVAWSRAEWIESTIPVWKELVDPVAEQVAGAMSGVVPEEMRAMAGPLLGVMRSMGGAMFGTQIGQALGALASEVVGSSDVGLPLAPGGKAALLPQNVERFGEGLDVPADEVRLYLALREAAHQRLFAHVPWLRRHLFGAVEAYARGIRVDTARLEDMVGQLDPGNPEALQEALQGGLFQPQDTPAQKAALARLETALALVEGWVDAVVHAAAASHLPHSAALRETLRRRRATGGPAEQTFATLVGLELRPRRLRDASRLWASLADARGPDGRDALWAHPDMLPTADDLDDPDGFVHREEADLGEFDFSALDTEPGDAGGEREGGGGKPRRSGDGRGGEDTGKKDGSGKGPDNGEGNRDGEDPDGGGGRKDTDDRGDDRA